MLTIGCTTALPVATLLQVHPSVAGILGLRSLNARGPFPIAICHPRSNLGEDDLGDFGPWNRSCSVCADRFSKIAAITQRNDLANNLAAFRRLFSCGEVRLRIEVNNDGPSYLWFATGWRHHVGADKAGEFGDGGGMSRLPRRERFLRTRMNPGSRNEDGGLVHG